MRRTRVHPFERTIGTRERVSGIGTRGAKRGAGGACGFSLVELITVVGIIAILSVIAVPTFRGISESSQTSRIKATFSSLITTAQIPSYEQPSGLLVMRARKHPGLAPGPDGDADKDNPALDFQEVRVVTREPFPDNPFDDGTKTEDIPTEHSLARPYFRTADNTEPETLGTLTWVAPDYAIEADKRRDMEDAEFDDQKLTEPYTEFPAGEKGASDPESLLNAFFIVYDRGECVTLQPSGDPTRPRETANTVYAVANEKDKVYVGSGVSLGYKLDDGALWINHETARGLLLYSRAGLLENVGQSSSKAADSRRDYLRTEATPLYCGRYGGDMLGGMHAPVAAP